MTISHVVLYHHALGLTSGVKAFADELRDAGHTVTAPDLFAGATFTSLDEGVAHVDSIGVEALLDSGASLLPSGPSELVFGGFSLGALIAHKLAQTHPNPKGAVLYHYGDVPMNMFGESWPPAVPVQFHISEHDEWREAGVVEGFVTAVETVAPVQLFEYPGSAHLFTDPTSAEFDSAATGQTIKRTIKFLDTLT